MKKITLVAALALSLCACSGRSYVGVTHAGWKSDHPYAKQDWVLTVEGENTAIYGYVDAVPSLAYDGTVAGAPQYSATLTTYTLAVNAAGLITESAVSHE